MTAQIFRKLHEARIDIVNGDKTYIFTLCNGDQYRFVIPTIEHECEGVKYGIH
jgi:hypothetical protein